jgi:hypothetical protein
MTMLLSLELASFNSINLLEDGHVHIFEDITDLDDLDGSALTDISIIFYELQIKKKQCRPIAEFPTPEALNRWDDRHLTNNQVVNWSTSIACYLSSDEFLSVTSCLILH